MAEEKKGGGGGGSPPEMWQIIGLVLLVLIAAGYVWYKHSEDPNWNPYNLANPSSSVSPAGILP